MPSTTLSSVFMVLLSSMVITPSLPTFSKASESRVPISSSPADTLATCAIAVLLSMGLLIFLSSSTVYSVAFAIPFFSTIGFAPAAMFFIPSRMIVCARRAAVVVPSPATSLVFTDTSFTSCAPIFSKASSSSISLAMVTPSFVMRGAPNFLSRTTFLPFGPKVILTASARVSTPFSRERRASSPYLNCLLI